MKRVPFLLLGVFILQCCCIDLTKSCDIFENPLGSVTPDQDVEVGSPFKFRCTLFNDTVKNHSVTSADIILNFTNRSSPSITLTPTSIIDDYTVEYAVDNASLKDNGAYSCYVPTLTEKTPQIVCMAGVSVGYPPLNVTNFTCISLEYTNLTCTWTEPVNNVRTQYILQDFLHDNKFFKRKCPVPIKPSGCQYRLDTKPVYFQAQENLSFLLVGKNSLGESKQYFKIRHYEIIKPGMPTFVQFNNVRETSLVINISAPKGLQYREFVEGLVYSIKYYSVSTPLNITKEVLVTSESGNVNLGLRDLVPHTVYDFEVRCHLNIKSDRFIWSDTRIATELTKSDVPYFAPVVHASAFDYQNIAGNRTITIYWQPVLSQFENGEDFVYYIRYHEYYVPSRFKREASKSSSDIKVGNKTSATIEHLDPGQAYIFSIVAANKEGKSSNDTAQIVIDKTEKMLPGPRDISVISYGKDLYNISWKAPDVRYSRYVLFWCENHKLSSAKCDGPLNMVTVTDQTKRELFLPDRNTNYQFAVATVHNSQTSGMYWAPCTVVYNMKYKVLKMELIPKTSTSLRVRWSMRCEAEKKVVKEYSIHYCPFIGNCTYNNAKRCEVDGKGLLSWPHVNILNSSSNEYILGSLTPYTCYAAYMRVRTGAGWGENSDFTYESTMQAAPSDPPGNVHAVVKDASITVSFDPPTIPNGRITRYVIYYNKTSADEANYHKEYRIPEDAHGKLPANINVISVHLDNVNYYTNYSIEVTACVDQACSIPSEPIYVSTGISNPGIVIVPRVEILENNVNISWAPPLLPNGPVHYYQVWVDAETWDHSSIYNVSGSTFMLLDRKCDVGSNNETQFEVRAVNLKDGNPLFGEFSGPTKTILCPFNNLSLTIGISIGVCVAVVVILTVVAYFVHNWYKKVTAVKRTKIQLPKGLDSPMDNPLNSYDKFKSGLKNHHDSGIPNDRAYDRLFSSNSDGNLIQTEDKRGPSGRNNSGESTASGKCHTSISSANTTKTHTSMDSGAEVESPLSPDSFSSDSGSSNTTPLPFQPDLNIVDELNHLASRDSGLERDNLTSVYVPRVTPRFEEQDGPLKSHLYEEKERMLSALSNSAPSVDDEIHQENAISSYAKFGYGRSQSDKNLDGYSKFGEPGVSGQVNPTAEFRNHQVCPSLVVNGPNRFSSLSLGRSKEDSLLLKKKKSKEQLLKQKSLANENKLYSVVGEALAPSNPGTHYVAAESTTSQRTIPSQTVADTLPTAAGREMQQSVAEAARAPHEVDSPTFSRDQPIASFLENLKIEDVLPADFDCIMANMGRYETADKDSGNGSDQDANFLLGTNSVKFAHSSGGSRMFDGSCFDLIKNKGNGTKDDCCTDNFGVLEEECEIQNNSPADYTTKPQKHFVGYVSTASCLPVKTQPNADISVESV